MKLFVLDNSQLNFKLSLNKVEFLQSFWTNLKKALRIFTYLAHFINKKKKKKKKKLNFIQYLTDNDHRLFFI